MTALFVSNQSGDSVNFNPISTNAIAHYWDFGDSQTSTLSNPSHQYTQPGTYTVCLTATSACNQDTFCRSVQVCAPINANFTWTQAGDSVNFIPAATNAIVYYWDFGDSQTSTSQSPSHQYAQSGTYNVCLITTSLCSQETFCQVITHVGIDELNVHPDFQILPNPATDQAWIVFNSPSSKSNSLEILDLQGLVIRKFEYPANMGSTKFTLDLSEFAKGTYFVRVIGNSGQQVKKLLIE